MNRTPPASVLAAICATIGGGLLYGAVQAFLGNFAALVVPLTAAGLLAYALWRGDRAAPTLAVIIAVATAGIGIGFADGLLTVLLVAWAVALVVLVTVPAAAREWFRTPQPAQAR